MNYEQAAQLFEIEIEKQYEAQQAKARHPVTTTIISHIIEKDTEALARISNNILRGSYTQHDLEAIHKDTCCQSICYRLLRHTHNQLSQTLQTPSYR
jgi:hypothetical protein